MGEATRDDCQGVVLCQVGPEEITHDSFQGVERGGG